MNEDVFRNDQRYDASDIVYYSNIIIALIGVLYT